MRQQYSWQALGSAVVVTIVHARTPAYGESIAAAVRQRVGAFEKRFSRFLPDSELSAFNRRAGKKVRVSGAFGRLLTAAIDLSAATGGLYNPFVLPALQHAGYRGSWPSPEQGVAGTDFSERRIVLATNISTGPGWARIPQDTALDFGGIGKGYLLDELAAFLDTKGLDGYWLSLGGDIICNGYDTDSRPWQIGVQHAEDARKIITTVDNHGTRLAVATSGVTKRQGSHNGQLWHHLIDPRTGKPAATTVLTATVTAEQATAADVYAKCAVIAGAAWIKGAGRAGVVQSWYMQEKGKA